LADRGGDVGVSSSLSVGWEARTAATRYLCVAAHLRRAMLPGRVRDGASGGERDPRPVGRAYARRVIRGPGIIAPCPGVDTAWVIRQCHASWTQMALRDCAAAAVLIACGYFYPAGTALWLGILLAALVLSVSGDRMSPSRRLVGVVVLACAAAAAVDYMVHGGRDVRSFEIPLLGFLVCLLIFSIDVFAVWVRLRRMPAVLGREPRTAFPFGPLVRDLEAASTLHRGNVVFYERGRIVGAGTPDVKRTLTTPIDEPKAGHRPERFKAAELLDYIAGHIRRQGADGDSTFGLPELKVQEVLARPASEIKRAGWSVPPADIRQAANTGASGSADRAYVAARATSWDGELTGSIFVSVALEGRYLRLVVLPYVMAPVVDELRIADQIAARGLTAQVPMSVLGGAREIGQILGAVRERVRKTVEKPAPRKRPEPVPPPSTTRSLREAYAKDATEDLHQREDGARIVQVMEQRVFTVVETFLDEHGIATARFRAQADQVINSYIMFTGDNNNVAVGSGARAGNPAAAQGPQQGAGA